MPEQTSYAPGTPSFTDLGSPDPDASARFYGELFGWNATEAGPVEETGGYRMFLRGDKAVAGLMPIMHEGQPPAWQTYITVESADDAAARAGEFGAQTIVPPMDVLDAGRMAVFADPTGAVFAVWQAGRSIGSEIVNEPVSLTWNEVMTRDPAAASSFYTSLFGWGTETLTDGPMPYTLFMRGDEQVAGMIEMNDQWPDEAPPSWGVYFAVEDCDATVEKAKELGGSLVIGPMDIPPGRFASIVDPHGAFFSVIALSPQIAG